MGFVLYILIAVLLMILVSGGYTFVVACVRRKELPWLDEVEIKKTSYGQYYENIVIGDKFLKENFAIDLQIESFDGLKLSGIWIPAQNPKGTILLAHGYRSSKMVDFSLAFGMYHALGLNILIPDQRAHGESEGKYITFGVKESCDMLSWISYHNKTFGDIPLVLSGLSMGASTMLYLADADLPQNVKCIIADCGFTSPREIIKNVFRQVVHLPAAPTLFVADLFARIFAGFSLTEKDTRSILQNSKLPILLVHGIDDGFVPCEMTRQAYVACKEPKEIFLVEGADHGVSFLVAKERYVEIVTAFLQKYVGVF